MPPNHSKLPVNCRFWMIKELSVSLRHMRRLFGSPFATFDPTTYYQSALAVKLITLKNLIAFFIIVWVPFLYIYFSATLDMFVCLVKYDPCRCSFLAYTQNLAPKLNGRYLCSNVNITSADQNNNIVDVPVGSTHLYYHDEVQINISPSRPQVDSRHEVRLICSNPNCS